MNTTEITFKVDPEKVKALKAALKNGIFQTNGLTAERKLDLFRTFSEDIDNSNDFKLSGRKLYTTIIREDGSIRKVYDLDKCHTLRYFPNLFAKFYKECFVEMTVDPSGYEAKWFDENGAPQSIKSQGNPMDISIWNIYTPSIYATLLDIVPQENRNQMFWPAL